MTGRAPAFLLLAVALAACQRTGVILTVRADGIVADQLAITASFDGRTLTQRRPEPAAASPLDFPESIFADFGDAAVDVTLAVAALRGGDVVASATLPSLHVAAGQHASGDLDLAPPSASYRALVLADHPLAYYRLDEPAGSTVAHDASGNGLDGRYGERVTRGAPGLLAADDDGAAVFNGGNGDPASMVRVPASPLLEPTTTMSIELWLQPLANSPDFTALVDYGDADDSAHPPPYSLVMLQNAISAGLLISADGTTSDGAVATKTQPAPLQRYHCVQTYDGSSLKLYVNGVLDAQQSVAGPISGYGASGLGIGGGASASWLLVFAGTLDEVAIYGAALTPAQVMTHYTTGARAE
jgi:hypothetical protein